MSSSESDVDSDSSSSDGDALSLTNKLFDESSKEDDSSLKITHDLILSTTTHASIIVSALLRDKQCANGGRTSSRRYIHRDRKEHHEVIIKDYFSGDQSKYTADHFRRRFRMDVELFSRILVAIEKNDSYFPIKFDATRKEGLSPLQKT
ncbi:unnamed protein product [Cuscuta epithymum]|uniref:Uncharacterized protein n=1 Tax=Cuscuta epithymum TaxID=186058 RepID=A0AAV0E5K7_9ASTE|nr:unnamed protein product [Cuscuta epithymum]